MVWRPDVLGPPARASRAADIGRRPSLRLGVGRPAADSGEPRLAMAAVLAALALAGIVNPKVAAGNLAPIDGVMLLAIVGVTYWALSRRKPLRMPYIVPMGALMILGLLAAMLSVNPPQGALAAVQEIFLVIWCAAVATVCCSAGGLTLIIRTWVVGAAGWAALLIFAVLAHLRWLSGAGAGNVTKNVDTSGLSGGTRARLLFDHPNMAGNFFMVAIFIAIAAGYPKRRWLRVGVCALLFVAQFLTGSNAAMLSLVVGGVVAVFLNVRSRSGLMKASAVAAVIAAVLGIGWFEVVLPVVSAAHQSNNALLRDSLGRANRSADARAVLFESQFKLYERGNLLGIGPSGTKDALGASGATAVKQAHNDYLGTLVERGPLGELALFVLIGAVWIRAARITQGPLPPKVAAAVPVPAALVGACVAFAVTALTHEILHYRWFWTLLAVVAAVYSLARSEEEESGEAVVPVRGMVPGPVDALSIRPRSGLDPVATSDH